MTQAALLEAWHDHLALGLRRSEHTVRAYMRTAQRLLVGQGLADWDAVADLSAGHLRTHLAARREQGLSNASAARELSALKSFIAFARTQAGREVSDAPRMRGPRIAKGLPRPVTPDDAIGLAETVDALAVEDWVGARDRAVLLLLYGAGLRIAEALSITSGDCKATSERVEIRVLGKGKKERKVWITSTLYEEITGTFHGAKHLFESKSLVPLHDRNVAKELGRLGAKHLGRHVTPHMLRHSFATHMIAKTGKRKAVSEYLGHSSTAITEDMYNHETLTDSDLGLGADLLKSAIGLRSDGCCLRS